MHFHCVIIDWGVIIILFPDPTSGYVKLLCRLHCYQLGLAQHVRNIHCSAACDRLGLGLGGHGLRQGLKF